MLIVEAVPSTANGVPLLCQYIVFTMVLVCVSIMTTVAVLNIHYRGSASHVMSDRVKKVKYRYLFCKGFSNIQLCDFGVVLKFRC